MNVRQIARNMLSALNYRLGRLAASAGYRIERTHRYPRSDFNLLRLGVLFLMRGGSERVSVIQIGAYDGHSDDPLSGLLDSPRLFSIIVEPQPIPFAVLEDRYRGNGQVRLENALLGPADGIGQLFVPADVEHSQLATTTPGQLGKFGYGLENTRVLEVPSISARTLLQKYDLESLDVLQIDAEGADLRILEQFLDAGIEPGLLSLEAAHLDKDDRLRLYSVLSARGYSYIDNNLDVFALKNVLLDDLNASHAGNQPSSP